MEINILEEIKKEMAILAEKLSRTLSDAARLTDTHLNRLPQTGLMGDVDETQRKKSVVHHYNFVRALGEKLDEIGEQRSALLMLCERLDLLSSKSTYEDVEAISILGKDAFEFMKKIEETESVSGRFINSLDRFADSANKGKNADFRAASRICREYFEFVTKTCSYIDNLRFF